MEMRGGAYFKSTWNLYEPLNFMKPYFKALLFGQVDHKYTEADEEYDIKYEQESFDEHFDHPNVNLGVNFQSESEDDEMKNWKFSCRLSSDQLEDVVDITEDDNDSAVVLSEHVNPPVKKIRLSRIDSMESSLISENPSAVDDSLHFFKSLLPFMTKLNDIQKLRVRSTIQDVILNELEGAKNS